MPSNICFLWFDGVTFHIFDNKTIFKMRDEQIFELIEAEHQRQLNGLELIASENFTSDQVLEATG